MNYLTLNRKFAIIRRLLSGIVCFSFLGTSICPSQAVAQTVFNLPTPGTVVTFSQPFTPPLVRGITLYPDNPLKFDFIVDVGDDHLAGDAFQKESMKLIKYFLVSLTVPENDMWVNLSPYEKDRIVPEHFGKTEMGRDLLLQDYMLKQLTASLMNPEQELGAKFWDRVREKAKQKFGVTDIPLDTFNKVWIVPDKAQVYVKGQSVYVVDSHLKVMLEEDYLARENSVVKGKENSLEDTKETSQLTKDLIREVIIPEIEKEINEGKNFAPLRQIQNSAILAAWYKKNLKQTLLGKVYVDQKKTDGIKSDDKEAAEKIYNQYLEAFKKGVYNYIKEDYDPNAQEVVSRKYFSGGIINLQPVVTVDSSVLAEKQFANRTAVTETVALKSSEDVSIPDPSSKFDVAMLSSGKGLLKKGLAIGTVASFITLGSGYSWMRWGYNLSPSKVLTIPVIEPDIVFQDGHIIKYDSRPFLITDQVSHKRDEVYKALDLNSSSTEFWSSIFSDYPKSDPVSAILTLDVIQKSFQTGQLDNLFNGLRTQPDLVYRYFSEIPDEQMQEFSRYFAKLKPGIRQQIFQIFYQGLWEDFQILENGKNIKSVLFRTSLQRAERMRRLYGEMVRMLNVIQPLKEGQIPEGPLNSVPDNSVAPYEDVTFTKEQAAEGLYATISQIIEDYRSRGYTIVMPQANQVNLGDVEGLISHYSIGYMLGKQSFYIDNKAGLLLQWVQSNTAPNNSRAHRITQKELITQAMRLAEDPDGKKVNLFDAIATISHLFKSLTRSPGRLLGAYWMMQGQDGVDYVWNHFQPNILTYSLYYSGAESVDDQGRPVIFWRPVNSNGDDSIPAGQRTGIKRPDSGHDFYHGWGTLLMSIYTRLKSFHDVKIDLYGQETIDIDYIRSRFNLVYKEGRYNFGSTDMDYLPLFFKVAQSLGIEDFALSRSGFSKKNGSEPEMIFNEIGSRLTEDISLDKVTLGVDVPSNIVTLSAAGDDRTYLKSLQGGIDLDQYVGVLNESWNKLEGKSSTEAIEERARLIITTDQVLALEKTSGRSVAVSPDLRKYLFSSAKENHLSKEELDIQVGIFKDAFARIWNNYSDISAPFIFDVLSYVSEPQDLERLLSIKQQLVMEEHLLPETYDKLANDPNIKVREALASNQHLPEATLIQLLSDNSLDVVMTVLMAPNFTLDRVPASVRNLFPVDQVIRILSDDADLTTRLKLFFGLQGKYLNVNPNMWFNLSAVSFKSLATYNVYQLLKEWRELNPGQEISEEAYELLQSNESLFNQAKNIKLESSIYLKKFIPQGNLKVDLMALIQAVKDDLKLVPNDQETLGGIDFNSANQDAAMVSSAVATSQITLGFIDDPKNKKAIRELVEMGLDYDQSKAWRKIKLEYNIKLPNGFWNSEETARNFILLALDTIPGFKEARNKNDIKTMTQLYRQYVINYQPKDTTKYKVGGQQSFFYEVGGLKGLMLHSREFLGDKKSAVSLLRFVLPGLIDVRNPNALDPVEVERDYWTDPDNARYHILLALDTIPGFKEAREKNDIKIMAQLYREHVINYKVKDITKYSFRGQQSFFFEVGGLMSLMTHKREFLDKESSPAALLRFVLPGLIDVRDPDALDPLEVEGGYWADPENARYHIFLALDTIPGFKEAREKNDIKIMAQLYRQYVIAYQSKDTTKYKVGGQQIFFYEVGGLVGLIDTPREFLNNKRTVASLLRFVLPELIDIHNPDALDPVEVERDYWTDPENARYHIFLALDTIPGFKEAREKNDIKAMAELYRKRVIAYQPKDTVKYKRGGQTSFFYEVGGLSGLITSDREFLDKKDSAAALLRFVLPGLIDVRNPDALDPLEVEGGYWTDPENARYHIFLALDTIPGFKEAREKNDIKTMAQLYREYVINYKVKDTTKYRSGGQLSFFYEVGSLSGLMNHSREFLDKKASAAALLRFVLPGLIDVRNPDALNPVEVEDDYWTDPANARYHIFLALDTIPGFKEAREKNDIKTMARLYREHVINYKVKDTAKYKSGGQQGFFFEVGGLSGLMISSKEFLDKRASGAALLRFALPGLIDESNPDALKSSEVEKVNIIRKGSADDAAMKSDWDENPGGIDLNANEKTLVEQGDKIKLPSVNSSDWQNFQTNGFVPVIIKIAPPTSLPLLLGLSQTNSPEQLSHL